MNKIIIGFFIVGIFSCQKAQPEFRNFSISGSYGIETVLEEGIVIDIVLYRDSLDSIAPTFTALNCSVTVAGIIQESGITINDFTNPVEYIVTSKDGLALKYIVKAVIEPVTYRVGQKGPAGGYIFYINPNSSNDGWKYLEALSWSIIGDIWGAFEDSDGSPYRIDGAYSPDIGMGRLNTQDMVKLDQSEVSAGKICYDFSIDNNGITYSDWFLPSIGELRLIYKELHLKEKGGYDTVRGIWSSTQSEIIDEMSGAYELDFDTGKEYDLRKFFTLQVIPVRAF